MPTEGVCRRGPKRACHSRCRVSRLILSEEARSERPRVVVIGCACRRAPRHWALSVDVRPRPSAWPAERWPLRVAASCAPSPLLTSSATEYDPAEAHLVIDFQHQIRQLRFADPAIERGAQLDQFWVLFLGCQGYQVQSSSTRSSPDSTALATAPRPAWARSMSGSRCDSARFGNDRRRW